MVSSSGPPMLRPNLLYTNTYAYASVVLRNLNESYSWWGAQVKLLCKPVHRSRPINNEFASCSSVALKSASQLPHCVTCITEPLLQHIHCLMDIPALSAKHTHTILYQRGLISHPIVVPLALLLLSQQTYQFLKIQGQISKAGTDLLQAPV